MKNYNNFFIYLKYWRESNDSLYIYYCFLNPDNCLKNDTCKDGIFPIYLLKYNKMKYYIISIL